MSRGQAFGRYDLVRRISSGGMAEVFQATHLPSSTSVALKRILPEIAEDEDFIKMFEDEARIVSHLEHPHIARCLDFGCVDGAWFISFEYVDGRDLRTLFDRCVKSGERPPLWFIVYVFSRIGEGLAYAHARKDAGGQPVSIVHRDVSPQNIIVSYDGDVKLIDFGIAKAAGKLSRTQVGTIKGKFGYMSPEQVGGREVDQRADVFSMGICMWELLTGKRLFLADNELLVLEKIRNQVVEPPSRFNPECPPELDRIVLKALAKNPDERYRAARELYRDINNLAQNINLVASREQIAKYMRRTFPEAREKRDDNGAGKISGSESQAHSRTFERQQVQENRAMAAENKGGSDLDIFEGLGKKASARPPAPAPTSSNGPRSAPPGPPPSRARDSMPMPGGDPAKKTLLGMQSPVGAGSTSSSSMPVAPPSSRSAPPPPPPGRGSLPPVMAPPAKIHNAPSSGVSSAPIPPPAASTRPAPIASGATARGADATDMDWDDEDEATHIFDKSEGSDAAPLRADRTRPAAGAPTPAPPPSSSMNALQNIPNKSTLLGMTAPLQPPPPPPPPPMSGAPPRMTPPPPPPSSVGGAFARASSVPSGAPGPVAFPPPPTIQPMPPPPHTSQGLGSTMPMHPPGHHGSTAPMPMPNRGPSQMPHGPHHPPPAIHQSHQPVQASDYPRDYPPPNRMEATALVRPPQSSKTGLWVALTLLVLALAGGAAAFFLMPRTGRIVVNVNDAKGGSVPLVQVFVDGKKECDTVPCFADKKTAGTHTVKVVAQGYDQAADQIANVEASQDSSVTFTLSTASSKKTGTGIKVAGTQAGVKLYVDDKEIGPLPQELLDMTPGDHTVLVKGTERYQSMEKKIIVAKDEILDMATVTLKVVKGKATVSLSTPGARVYLVSGNDRRELTPLPISVDIPTSQTWSLEASKIGFNDYKQAISFDDGQAEKTFAVELTPKGTPAPTTTAPVAQVPTTPPTTPPTPPTTPTTAPTTPPTAATTAAAAQGEAYLNINSMPPSSCFLDGVPLGMTPRIRQSVKPGAHRIKFMHPEAGTKEITVTAVAGQTVNAVLKL